ncbi:unnamed protein product [Pleuronectes platessa]|uniref:Uncharacterized protein n=1 Tax=Pleuronectes platessa TaxID=8262 RepID=A0A9N7UNZ7_PLEPL|nr:unnamed protein product [Pleuronectes platessa]
MCWLVGLGQRQDTSGFVCSSAILDLVDALGHDWLEDGDAGGDRGHRWFNESEALRSEDVFVQTHTSSLGSVCFQETGRCWSSAGRQMDMWTHHERGSGRASV